MVKCWFYSISKAGGIIHPTEVTHNLDGIYLFKVNNRNTRTNIA